MIAQQSKYIYSLHMHHAWKARTRFSGQSYRVLRYCPIPYHVSHTALILIFTAEFVWLGQNAIASWGFLDGETDATMTNSGLGGLQPRGTLVEENWVHEIGHLQKQSSFYFQAITAQTVIRKCVCVCARARVLYLVLCMGAGALG